MGRITSILAVGVPHDQILGLLGFELASSLALVWFLIGERKLATQGALNAA